MVLRRDGLRGQAPTLLADNLSSSGFPTLCAFLREPGRWWPVSVVLPPDAAARGGPARLRLRCASSPAAFGGCRNSNLQPQAAGR